MIDLDSTLMDSGNVRRIALTQALEELIPLVVQKKCGDKRKKIEDRKEEIEKVKLIEACVDFYESLVYDRWPLYLSLNLGDFRQKWNLGISYAVFLDLLTYMVNSNNDTEIKGAFVKAYLSEIEKKKRECQEEINKLQINPEKIQEMLRELNELKW